MFLKLTQNLEQEKVYSVFGTPTQHTCGVSKTNTKLTQRLKIRTQQLRLFKRKTRKYLLNFHYPATSSPKQKISPFSLTQTLCFSRTSTSISHQHLHLPFSTPNLDSYYLPLPVIISSDETDLCLVGKRPLSLFLSHHLAH